MCICANVVLEDLLGCPQLRAVCVCMAANEPPEPHAVLLCTGRRVSQGG